MLALQLDDDDDGLHCLNILLGYLTSQVTDTNSRKTLMGVLRFLHLGYFFFFKNDEQCDLERKKVYSVASLFAVFL